MSFEKYTPPSELETERTELEIPRLTTALRHEAANKIKLEEKPFAQGFKVTEAPPSNIRMHYFREYSVAYTSNGAEVQVLDDNGTVLTKVTTELMQKRFDWADVLTAIRASSGLISIYNNPLPNGYRISNLENLPPHSRRFIQYLVDRYATQHVSTVYRNFSSGYAQTEVVVTLKSQTFSVVNDDRYLMFVDSATGGFLAFDTMNEAGIPLPPRNWRTITALDLDYKPTDDFMSLLSEASSEKGAYKRINDRYAAHIRQDYLSVYESGTDTVKFTDKVADIGSNLCVDPANNNVIYYCSEKAPSEIFRLDMSNDDPTQWVTEPAPIPQYNARFTGLTLDPTSTFFMARVDGKGVTFWSKETLGEAGSIEKLFSPTFGVDGQIKGLNENCRLAIYGTNIQKISAVQAQKKALALVKGIDAGSIFVSPKTATRSVEMVEKVSHLEPAVQEYRTIFTQQLDAVQSLDDMTRINQGLETLRQQLMKRLSVQETTYILDQIRPLIREKETELANTEAQGKVDAVTRRLSADLSIASIGEIRTDLDRLTNLPADVSPELRRQIDELSDQFSVRIQEVFRKEAETVKEDMTRLVGGVEAELSAMTSLNQFDTWVEYSYPQLRTRLGTLLANCPLEATELRRDIINSVNVLGATVDRYQKQFEQRYSELRQAAVELIDERVDSIEKHLQQFVQRLSRRHFSSRDEADRYIQSSNDYGSLQTEVRDLVALQPDAAKTLERKLKAELANLLGAIERGGKVEVAETGQQMVMLGGVAFPKWEAKTKERGEREVDLAFIEDKSSRGPGVRADQLMGDVGLQIRMSDGTVQTVRLYEGTDKEDEWRLGSVLRLDEFIPPTYLPQQEYQKIRRDYRDWSRGEQSTIRQGMRSLRGELRRFYQQYRAASEGEKSVVRQDYLGKLQEYANFCRDNHVSVMRRIDRVKQQPEVEHINGKGFVPEWQSHWVVDTDTEKYLAELARMFKMQLDTQEGVVDLKGHAGTGKDVLIKMFCHLTNRPYFAIDCSKWTTEFELSEDVVLEAEGGATQTVKVPSTVLNAITTPGAMMYFNEINAMPEQAQIFLHGLFDEKRSLTLKTSSGKTVKALPSVTFASSRNPNYPGTFEPQYATKSRMVPVEVHYPPVEVPAAETDSSRAPRVSGSEALRIARNLDSLDDLTFDPDPIRNEFLKLWDRHINRVDNGAPDLTAEQAFDLGVILALVQFSDRLRQNFILKFEKSRESRDALPVTQPLTGREMRRFAYFLSQMPQEQKVAGKEEETARYLIERFFLCHIDSLTDRDKIRTALSTWTSKKRGV